MISELLAESKRKRKRKKIRLFDIIDSIPLTSSGSDDDSELSYLKNKLKKKQTKRSSSNIPNLGMTFLPDKLNYATEQKPLQKKSTATHGLLSGLPNPPPANSVIVQESTVEAFKPKLSRYLDPNNKEDDPLSWLNIIRASRNEAKETQTDKTIATDNLRNQEIQTETEFKEMLEIPKSQTFFTTNTIENESKTKEFCDRVRQEVLSKLNHVKQLEDKRVQTFSNAGVQTSGKEKSFYVPPFEKEEKPESNTKEPKREVIK